MLANGGGSNEHAADGGGSNAPRMLRPIPRERLRDGKEVSAGDQSVGSPASASAGARARCESAEKLRALRNDNWHLMCELDILRRALESERSGRHAAQAPEVGSERSAGQDGGERAATVGEGKRETPVELRAQLQAERERVKDLEAECRAWSTLLQSVMASMQGSGRGSAQLPRRDAGPCTSADTAGAKALFGTISNLIAAEESALQAQAPLKPKHSSAAHADIDVAPVPGGAASSEVGQGGRLLRKNPRDWLHWKDKEEVLSCSIPGGWGALLVCVGSRVAPSLHVHAYLYISVHMCIDLRTYTHARMYTRTRMHTHTNDAIACGGYGAGVD